MAIGRPIELTPNITSKNISIAATEGQTDFTVTGGYRINEIAVYRNGVRLVDGRDFSATDGQTVTLISDTVDADDVLEFSVFDSFDIAGVIVGAASSQAVNGNLHVTGELYAGDFLPAQLNVTGVGTIGIGSFTDIRVSGGATFDGSTTTSGAASITDTTETTSTSTGALVVSGGVGVAKSLRVGTELHVGGNVSVAGTLTYEDVTSVDSVGLITAQSGVNITGGELKVGTAVTIGSAGIITSHGGTIDLKNSGSVSNIKLYCESGNSHYTQIQSAAHGSYSGNVTLTLPTTTDTLIGRTTTDTLTNKTLTSPTINTLSGDTASFSSNLTVGSGITFGSAGVATFSGTSDVHLLDNVRLNVGDGSDLTIYHDATNSYIKGGSSGELVIRHDAITMQAASSTDTYFDAVYDGEVSLRYNNSKKFETTNEGIEVTGFTSTTAGMGVTGGLYEGSFIKAGKLTDNLQIGIATANIFYFTTAETTTGTPNIRWDDTYSLSSKMAVGDVVSLTVITTAAAAGYCANWTIDGNAVTEEWVGGSAPSAGGADGLDIYGFTIIKTGTGTGDSGFKVIGNVTNAT